MNPLAILYVALGGAFGSVARYLMINAVGKLHVSAFPYGTFAVNILGSTLMGLWIGIMATMLPEKGRELHLLFAVGVLGGFTTFSTFSLDIYSLLQSGLNSQAALYIGGSIALSLVGLFAGLGFVRMVAP